MKIMDIPCRRENFGGLRASAVEYIVVHYTAGHNDTAVNNGQYFARERVGASAHYFVDEGEIVRSVPEERVAYHCGGSCYDHPRCRNGNSIGVELCTKWDGGTYAFAGQTVENARTLIRELMKKYDIPAERVIRHWDVTRKVCPAPFVGAGQAAWEAFKGGLMGYDKIEDVPAWARPTAEKLVEKGILQGGGQGLDLSHDMVRLLVILDRAGVFEEKGAT